MGKKKAAPEQQTMSTAQRLDGIIASFDTFDTEMRVGTRQRREKDEFKVFQMEEKMTELEKELETSVHRRGEVNKSMTKWCEREVERVREAFAEKVALREVEFKKRVEALNRRLEAMDRAFQVDMAAVPVDIEQRGRELAARLTASMHDFDDESKSRLDREAAMSKTVADHVSLVAKRFDAHRTERENSYVHIRTMLDEHVRQHTKKDEVLKNHMDAELARLANAITIEAKARWREDAELADAMDGYVDMLQKTLHVVNSDAV